jgi:osmotically-inducible protein OsmY
MIMKTDSQLQIDVMKELDWEPSVHHEHIGVAVNNGIVTLSGAVPSFIEKTMAERATQRVGGVKAVVEKIEVKLPGSYRRDDQDIARTIVDQINWSTQLVDEQVKASVEDGWVRLTGEVAWEYQRTAAERIVRELNGVRGITNNIILKAKVRPVDIKDKIEQALKRAAERESKKIIVEVQGSKVILSGTVRSQAELRDAEGAVWGAPGVTEIEDRLNIIK